MAALSVGEGEAAARQSWGRPARLGWGCRAPMGGGRGGEALPGAEAGEPARLSSSPQMCPAGPPGPRRSEGCAHRLTQRFAPPYK